MSYSIKDIDEGIQFARQKISEYNLQMMKLKNIHSLDFDQTMLLANLRLNRDITQATLEELEKMKEAINE